MRKVFFLLVFSASLSPLFSQVFLGGGYGFSWMNAEGLNHSITRYNETRSFLTKNMEELSSMSGFNFEFEAFLESMFFSFNYSSRTSTLSSEGIINGQNFTRELSVGLSLIGIGLGFGNYDYGSGFAFLINTDFMAPSVYSQVSGNSEDEILTDIGLAVSPTIVFFTSLGDDSNIGIHFRAYYTHSILDQDYKDVNRRINPNTYEADNEADLTGAISGFGIEIKLGFVL